MQFLIENDSALIHTIHFPVKFDLNGNLLPFEIWGQVLGKGGFICIAETIHSPYKVQYSEAMINKKVNYRLCYKSEDANGKFTEIKNVLIR